MECIRAHERPSVTFTDILKKRHEESDFMWVSREFNWTKAYSLNKNMKNPSFLQKEVLKSQRILRLINEVCCFGSFVALINVTAFNPCN